MLGFIKRKVFRVTAFIQHFLQEAHSKVARSTALHSLIWGLGILVTGISLSIGVGASVWVVAILIGAVMLLFVNIIVAFWYLLFKNPDMLRSESYAISKMMLEQGLRGDNITGLIKPRPRVILPDSNILPAIDNAVNFGISDNDQIDSVVDEDGEGNGEDEEKIPR